MALPPHGYTDGPRAEIFDRAILDLRTRLAAIKGAAVTALGPLTPLNTDEMLDLFRIVEGQADQIYELINRVLSGQTLETPGTEALAVESQESQAAETAVFRPAAEGGRILAAAKDTQLLRLLHHSFTSSDYPIISSNDPDSVERLMEDEPPDLVLMELAREGATGEQLLQRLSQVSDAPVIFVSSESDGQFVEEALGAGAADCLFMPFSSTELAARAKAALRKRAESGPASAQAPFTLRDLTINYDERRVYVSGKPVKLTATEYRLLAELATNAGRILTHEHLLREVWGRHTQPDLRGLRAFVKNIRRKLGDDARTPKYIFTESRVGYRMANYQAACPE